jgi:hypothetical protein
VRKVFKVSAELVYNALGQNTNMNALAQKEYRSLALSFVVLLFCVFLLGELAGFQYGYHGAYMIEHPDAKEITFAVHGVSYLSPMIFAYVIGLLCSGVYILLVFGSKDFILVRLAFIGIGAAALARGLYYKYLVFQLTGTPGFLNPYQEWMLPAVVMDVLCLIVLGTLIFWEIRSWRSAR